MKKGWYLGPVKDPVDENGWLIGSFLDENHPCFSRDVEIAWKEMGLATKGEKHFHKTAIEIWIVIKGSVTAIINDQKLVVKAGSYLVVHPLTQTEILNAAKGTSVLVVKAPSIPKDKYPC